MRVFGQLFKWNRARLAGTSASQAAVKRSFAKAFVNILGSDVGARRSRGISYTWRSLHPQKRIWSLWCIGDLLATAPHFRRKKEKYIWQQSSCWNVLAFSLLTRQKSCGTSHRLLGISFPVCALLRWLLCMPAWPRFGQIGALDLSVSLVLEHLSLSGRPKWSRTGLKWFLEWQLNLQAERLLLFSRLRLWTTFHRVLKSFSEIYCWSSGHQHSMWLPCLDLLS